MGYRIRQRVATVGVSAVVGGGLVAALLSGAALIQALPLAAAIWYVGFVGATHVTYRYSHWRMNRALSHHNLDRAERELPDLYQLANAYFRRRLMQEPSKPAETKKYVDAMTSWELTRL